MPVKRITNSLVEFKTRPPEVSQETNMASEPWWLVFLYILGGNRPTILASGLMNALSS